MSIIWATRGRDWGFRFLRRDRADPLARYERVFDLIDGQTEGLARVEGDLGLRFADPENRSDRAGRPIVHDVLLSGDRADRIRTLEEGVAAVWPLIADEYARVWDQPAAPPSE